MTRKTAARPGAPDAPATSTRSAEGAISINAAPERVWQALTDAEELTRWFPLDARVQPGPGGSIFMSWRNEFAAEMKILAWDPPHHLRTGWSFHQDEQPPQITDYVIEGQGGSTAIRVVTSGFPLDASWDGWVEGTNRGWAFELYSLKHYLERHAGEPRHVIYLRRRAPLSSREIWERLSRDTVFGPLLTAGRPFDVRPASQYAAVLDDPADALMRVSVEPAGPGAPDPETVIWLSAWGEHDRRTAELRERWAGQLERLFS